MSGSWGHTGEIGSPVCCPNCASARIDIAPHSGRDEYRCQCCGLIDDALAFRPSHMPGVSRPVPPTAERLSISLAREMNISLPLARRMVQSLLPQTTTAARKRLAAPPSALRQNTTKALCRR
ncbi:hypothetical protein [Deinococcus xinjiangensis]|uniref:hypothetical protein n=1 Tax=Deinococcus xinjiangensis TaxID=457454 RepID=UPI0033653771